MWFLGFIGSFAGNIWKPRIDSPVMDTMHLSCTSILGVSLSLSLFYVWRLWRLWQLWMITMITMTTIHVRWFWRRRRRWWSLSCTCQPPEIHPSGWKVLRTLSSGHVGHDTMARHAMGYIDILWVIYNILWVILTGLYNPGWKGLRCQYIYIYVYIYITLW